MNANLPTQEIAFKKIIARFERQSTSSSDLSPDEITAYLQDIYDPTELSGPRFFYSQDEYGIPIARIPNADNSGVFCTVADTNTLEEQDWANVPKPDDFEGMTWPPRRLDDLTGSPQQSEHCIGCDKKGKSCTGVLCNQHSISSSYRDFWLKNILLRHVDGRGVGAFAREPIQSQTDIGELAGRVLPKTQDAQINFYHTHISIGTLPDVNYAWVDLARTGSVARYLNHSCAPNCKFYESRCGHSYRLVWVMTTKDIVKGEELTVDYGSGWFDGPNERCLCGEPNCKNPAQATPEEQAPAPALARPINARTAGKVALRTCQTCKKEKGKYSGLSDSQRVCKACVQREKDHKNTYACKTCGENRTGRSQGGKLHGPECRPCFDRRREEEKEKEKEDKAEVARPAPVPPTAPPPARQAVESKRRVAKDDDNDYEEARKKKRKRPRKQ